MTFSDLLPPYTPRVWKAIGIAIGLLILLAAVLFVSDRITGWWSTRTIDRAKGNVANALNAVNGAKEVVANDRIDEAVAVENVKRAVQDVVNASNASDAAKTATNAALANYEAAKKANKPVGTTEQELLDKLNELE